MTQTPTRPIKPLPPTPQSLFDVDDDNFTYSPSSTKQVSKQDQWEANYTDTIKTTYNPSDWDGKLDGLRQRQITKRGINPKRADKIFDKLKVKPDNYNFTEIPSASTGNIGDMTEYYKHFTDILINGNLRFKFIPKCSTRTGAKQYCESKFDDRGYPKYRLIEPNVTDTFGNNICDLNGDGVDDIIICNKRGVPVIINGYRLVRADPYKKIWKGLFASGKTQLEFNEWLAEQFAIVKDWSNLTEDDWKRGRVNLDLSKANEQARAAYEHFDKVGLGKPRLNTRLNPRALWSSLFSKFIWKNAIYSFELNNKEFTNIPKIFSYLKVANAVYIIYVESSVMQNLGIESYVDWVKYKNDNKTNANAKLGQFVQTCYVALANEVDKSTQEQRGSYHTKISSIVSKIIKECSFITNNPNNAKQLNAALENASGNELKYYKDRVNEEINNYIETKIPGYIAYVSSKPKKVKDFDKYVTMKMKVLADSDDE